MWVVLDERGGEKVHSLSFLVWFCSELCFVVLTVLLNMDTTFVCLCFFDILSMGWLV